MLRKFAYNKIFRTTGMLFLLLFLLLFPASKKYSLEEKNIKSSYVENKTEVYLLDKSGYIARCMIDILKENDESYVKKIVELLIIEGKYEQKIPNGFKGVLPNDLKINGINIEKENIYLDLSKEFYELSSENEIKAIELLTYNLTNINGIKNVYLKIEGKLLDYLPNSKKNVTQPFTKENGVNKKVEVTNYKDVNSTTVYYISKNNDNYYYVPVTKTNNDKREKIKIIIDELASSYIYETNLMSFLNYNVKLLDYKQEDDILHLNFNNYLFDDVSSKNVLEEVIYSICLSVRDNYDVNTVIFSVEGEEIVKSVIKNIEN